MLTTYTVNGKRSLYKLICEMLAFAGFAITVWLVRWALLGMSAPIGDGLVYLDKAKGIHQDGAHFFHILSPSIAGLFSDPICGYFALATFNFVGTSICLALLLRHPSFNATLAEVILGTALFMASYVGVSMFRSFFLNDSTAYFLLAVAATATLYQKNLIVSIVTLIGVFNRETAFFILPVWVIYQVGNTSLSRLAFRGLVFFLPAAIGYLLLHHTLLFVERYPQQFNFLSPTTMRRLWQGNLSWLGTNNVLAGLSICVFLSFGPTWFLSIRGYISILTDSDRKILRSLIALAALLLPVAASLLVVDWRRGYQPLFLMVIPSAVLGVRAMTVRLPHYHWFVLATGIILGTGICSEAWWITPMRTPVAIGLAISFFSIVFVLVTRWQQNTAPIKP